MMVNSNTVKLLRECDAGTKMAVSSIEEIFDRIQDMKLKELLQKSKKHHEELGNELHELLNQEGCEDKEPNPMAKGMSWMKTNMKMGMEESDSAAADLLTDGCNMGIKSLYRYLNQYKDADNTSREICKKLISIEGQLRTDLRKYL